MNSSSSDLPDGTGRSPELMAAQQSADRIEAQLVSLRQANQSTRRLAWLVALIIVLEVVLFGFASYRKVSTAFQPQKLTASISEKMPDIRPEVTVQMSRLIEQIGPTYRKLASERFKEAGPVILQDLTEEARELPAATYEDARELVEQVATNVVQRVEVDLREVFPQAMQPEVQQRLLDEFRYAVIEQGDDLRDHLDGIFQRELKRVNASLVTFEVPRRLEQKAELDLMRLVLHHLLMLADHTVMSEEPLPDLPIQQDGATANQQDDAAQRQPGA